MVGLVSRGCPCQLRTESSDLLKVCDVPCTFPSIFSLDSRVFCASLLIARLLKSVSLGWNCSILHLCHSAVLSLSMRDSLCSFLHQGKSELKQELTSLPAWNEPTSYSELPDADPTQALTKFIWISARWSMRHSYSGGVTSILILQVTKARFQRLH